MSDCGYKCEPQNNGNVTVTPIEGDDQLPHVVLSTYYCIWQRDYPKLKVSKPAEDICDLCTKFANRHAFLANHKTLSSGDANINCEEDADLFIIIEEIESESKLDDEEERDDNEKQSQKKPTHDNDKKEPAPVLYQEVSELKSLTEGEGKSDDGFTFPKGDELAKL